MVSSEPLDIAVVGSGGAGTMAYLRAVLNRDRTILFTGDAQTTRQGRAIWVAHVDNIPGFHDITRPIVETTSTTLKWIESQENLRDYGTVIRGKVDSITQVGDLFTLRYTSRKEEHSVRAKYVIVATGIMDVQPEIGGSIKPVFPYANRGDFLYCVRCDGHKTIGHTLGILGHTDIAIHIGALMKERYGHETLTILTNGKEIDISERTRGLAKAYKFQIIENPLTGILGDPKTTGLKGFAYEGGEVKITQVIVALGIIAYNQLLTDFGVTIDEKGKIVVDQRGETSVPNLFVAGDLVSGKKMQIYTGWDGAVDTADEINKRLRLQLRKEKGIPGYR